MKPRWTRGVEEGEQYKKDLKANFLQADLMRERLVVILEEEISQSIKEMRDAAKGDIKNLSAYYADELSKQRTLEYVIQLIKE